MKTGNYEWSAAAGWARDSDRRPSPYLRLGVMTRRYRFDWRVIFSENRFPLFRIKC
jgi:hypothetical protein